MGVDGQRNTTVVLFPGKRRGTHCIGGWEDHSAGLEGAENLATTGIRSPHCPARSESLYRLSYTGPIYCTAQVAIINVDTLSTPRVLLASASSCKYFFNWASKHTRTHARAGARTTHTNTHTHTHTHTLPQHKTQVYFLI